MSDELSPKELDAPQLQDNKKMLFTLREIRAIILFLAFMSDNHEEGDAFEILEALGCEGKKAQ